MASIPCELSTQVNPAEEILCSQCSKLNLRRYLAPLTLRLLWKLPSTVSFDYDLEASASSECNLCRLLSRSLSSGQINIPAQIKTITFKQFGQTETLSGSSTASFCITPSEKNGQRLALYGKDAYRVGACQSSYGRMVQPDRACRELVIQWLKRCDRDHGMICSNASVSSVNDDFMPEYMVDVEEMRVHRVYEGKPEYLALSYVWGRIETLQLLKANRAELTTSGSLNDRIHEIPAVVRDAITFTKDIGYKFLWVDTLCICQDDAKTKERQIAGMSSIYARAMMTLVALEGLDATYGLPGVRPYKNPRHQYMEKVHQLRMMTIMPPISERLKHSVWRSRAWTFQEEQFSRRIIFFTEYQVYFRCQRSIFCEDRFEEWFNLGNIYIEEALQDGLWHLPVRGACIPTTANNLWMKMVEDYSKRNFSRDTDRHDAFAGIESQLRQSRFDYLCTVGMPVKHLVRELYWHHLKNPAAINHNSNRISCFPSWSWCGWDGGIILPKIGFRYHIAKIQISGESIVRIYDESGQLLESASTTNLPPLPLLLSRELSKKPATLSFEAYTSRLPLDTSRFNEEGLILIIPGPRKICGIIHCAHLSPECLIENINEHLECIQVASYHRPGAFDPCSYSQEWISELETWFSDLEIKRSRTHETVTEVHNRVFNQPTLKIIETPDHSSETESVSLTIWIWRRRIGMVLGGCYPAIKLLYILVCLLAIILLVISLAITFTITLAVFLVIMLVFCFLVVLVLLLLWGFQGVYNFFHQKDKWYLWNTSTAETQLGKLIQEKMEDIPRSVQNAFYRVWSGSPDAESYELKEKEKSYNVVNIILVKRWVVDGIEVCERLAIGQMSARCWWESEPTLKQIILQ